MIDPIQASSTAEGARLLPRSGTRGARAQTTGGASFAGELARFVSASASSPTSTTAADSTRQPVTVKAVARPDNEQTTKVAGHPYSRIINGADKGMYLNQLDGNPREGAIFKLVERDDRVFHVYGSGKDKLVVEIKAKSSANPPATGGAAPTTT